MFKRSVIGIWILLTTAFLGSSLLFPSSQEEQLVSSAPIKNTPLYSKTKQKIDDFYIDINRNQLTPWLFINSGKVLKIDDYYGKTTSYEGVIYEGSPRVVFWDNFIEPFLEHGTIEILEQVAKDAGASNLVTEQCINEAVNLLDSTIVKIYYRMAEIDRKLLGKGNPNNIKRRDVSQKIETMRAFLRQQEKAVNEISHAKRQRWYLNNVFLFGIIPILTALFIGIPAWIKLKHKRSSITQRQVSSQNMQAGRDINIILKDPPDTKQENKKEEEADTILNSMPQLISEMRTDLKGPSAEFIREFFVLPNRKTIIGINSKPRFRYYISEHPNLLGQLDILEDHGYVINVTPFGNSTPIYKIIEKLVKRLCM